MIDMPLGDITQQYVSAAAEEVRQVKTGAGRLVQLALTNVNAAARYAWIFDNTASSGTLALPPVALAIGETKIISLLVPKRFTTGLRVAASSTLATFTAAGAADLIMGAWYL